jgi:phage tail sheath protein FI
MPSALTYPGVYVEEISSGVHTISGVSTSTGAFIGWAPRGPTETKDSPKLVSSWADYVQSYGGLNAKSLLGYSVYQFFNNGGQQAYIIRLLGDKATKAAKPAGDLTFTAKNEGEWARNYGFSIKQRADDKTRFTLSVVFIDPKLKVEQVVEKYDNLSVERLDPRFVEDVVNPASAILEVTVKIGAKPPPTLASTLLAGGDDGKVLEDPNDAAFVAALKGTNGGEGYMLLEHADFNLLCVPGLTKPDVLSDLQSFCRKQRAFLIADCDRDATHDTLLNQGLGGLTQDDGINSAFYFPWIIAPDPLDENRVSDFPPCGFVAGLYAKTDVTRGVWKAPAGTEASLVGIRGVSRSLTDAENGHLNVRAINCIRTLPPFTTVLWGARTLRGNDEQGSEWKYIPVRRTALFIEQSLYRGLKWVVFEPNDEPLWSQIRLNVGAFMHDLFRQHAFQGSTPREAYFVKCDKETTTQNDIDHGIVNILVGFAPLKPAEFVVIKIQQMAGQIET